MCVIREGRILWLRQPLAQRSGGLLSINHSSRALCRDIMCYRVMNWVGREWGVMPPRIKFNVVDIAKVPQDHRGMGASLWISILGSCLYAGRGGIGRLREVKDSRRAR